MAEPVREGVAQPLPEAKAEAQGEGVLVRHKLGEAVELPLREAEAQPEAGCEGVALPLYEAQMVPVAHPVAEGVGPLEGERLPVEHTEGVRQPLPVAVALAQGEGGGLGVPLGVTLAQGVALGRGETQALALGLAESERVKVALGEALAKPVCVTEAVEQGEREGEPVPQGVGVAQEEWVGLPVALGVPQPLAEGDCEELGLGEAEVPLEGDTVAQPELDRVTYTVPHGEEERLAVREAVAVPQGVAGGEAELLGVDVSKKLPLPLPLADTGLLAELEGEGQCEGEVLPAPLKDACDENVPQAEAVRLMVGEAVGVLCVLTESFADLLELSVAERLPLPLLDEKMEGLAEGVGEGKREGQPLDVPLSETHAEPVPHIDAAALNENDAVEEPQRVAEGVAEMLALELWALVLLPL